MTKMTKKWKKGGIWNGKMNFWKNEKMTKNDKKYIFFIKKKWKNNKYLYFLSFFVIFGHFFIAARLLKMKKMTKND